MYCPSCGTQLAKELVYCPRCGANLASVARAQGVSPARLTGAAWALSLATALVTLGGLSFVFVFVLEALHRGMELPGGIFGLMVGLIAVVLAVASMLAYQLSRVVTLFKDAGEAPTAKRKNEFKEDAPPAARLEAPREPASSVTDQTTRTFEPVPRERQTRG